MKIRIIGESDAKEVSVLSGQLGYPTAIEKTAENIRLIGSDPNQVIYVAELGGAVVGWIHFQKRITLVGNVFVEIAGLIVDAAHRQKGIGKSLIEEGIKWAKQRNIYEFRVRSNAARNESHIFYKALGFSEVKTQKVYDRTDE